MISLNTFNQLPTKLVNYNSLLTSSSGSLFAFWNFDCFKFKASHFNFCINVIVLTRDLARF